MPTHTDKLKAHARQHVRPWDEHLVDRALAVAFRGHQGQKRETGEAFVEHPMAVARIVSSLQCDLKTFVAAILHDVVEDTTISLDQVADEFGRDVALVVDSLTKLSELERGAKQLSADSQRTENVRKLLVGAANDLRVAYIKLADRLHNLSTTDPSASDRVNRATQETATYFSPLARELGIGQLHRKLELWCLSLARPALYRVLESVIKHGDKDSDHRIRRIKDTLDSGLRQDGIPRDRIDPSVEDTILFVLRLIATETPSAHQIHHLAAHNHQLSWVFDSSVACYSALASIHTLWTPVYTHFQDWIASPMPSGYAAIHTLVDVGDNELVIFKLQTREMRQRAEWGPLFLLRDAYDYDAACQSLPQAALLSKIRELDRAARSTQEFLDFIRLDILPPKIRVFVKGSAPCHIPEGASVADLVCACCPSQIARSTAAVVNRQRVSLAYRLRDGDLVEILTDEIGPSTTHWTLGETHFTAAADQALLNLKTQGI